jgi:predicted nucleotidyltransferase
MQLKETRDALNIIQQSKNNLSKSKKNFSKQLYNSLDYDLNVSKFLQHHFRKRLKIYLKN